MSDVAGSYGRFRALQQRVAAGATVADRDALVALLHPRQLDPALQELVDGGGDPPPGRLPLAVPAAEVLLDYLEQGLEHLVTREDAGRPGERGQLYAWSWGYWGRALVYLYEATGEPRFLDLFAASWDRLLAQRDDRLGLTDEVRGRILCGWGVRRKDGRRATNITVAGLIALPVAELLLLLRRDAAAAARLRDRAASDRAEIEAVLGAFAGEYRRHWGAGYFVDPGSGRVEALNHMAVFGAALALTWVLAGDSAHRLRVAALSRFFRRAMTAEPDGSVSWGYEPAPGAMRAPGEGIWKATASLELPLAARRVGLAFDDEDMRRLARTLLWRVITPAGLAQHLGRLPPRLIDARFHGGSLAGQGLAIWPMLEAWHPAVTPAVLDAMAAQPALFPNGWFGGSRALLMTLAWLLRERTLRRRGAAPDPVGPVS